MVACYFLFKVVTEFRIQTGTSANTAVKAIEFARRGRYMFSLVLYHCIGLKPLELKTGVCYCYNMSKIYCRSKYVYLNERA